MDGRSWPAPAGDLTVLDYLVLALLHLVLRVAADDQDHALPADDLAPLTAGLD
jgi:hypothetical protein